MAKIKEKVAFFECLKAGKNQKESALLVGVSEKTAGEWAKEWLEINDLIYKSIAKLATRLNEITEDKTTPLSEIKMITSSMKELENMMFIVKSKPSKKNK